MKRFAVVFLVLTGLLFANTVQPVMVKSSTVSSHSSRSLGAAEMNHLSGGDIKIIVEDSSPNIPFIAGVAIGVAVGGVPGAFIGGLIGALIGAFWP